MASIIKSGNKYYIQFYDKNRQPKRKQVPTESGSISVARKLAKKLEAEYVLGLYDPWSKAELVKPNEEKSVATLLEIYIDEKSRMDWKPNTIYSNSLMLRKFSRVYGHLELGDLQSTHLNEFINAFHLSIATKKGYKAKLTTFIEWGIKHEYFSRSQFSEVKITKTHDFQDDVIKYFTDEDIRILTSYISGKVGKDLKKSGGNNSKSNALWLVDFIHWQRLSGMRLSETLNLRVNDVNLTTWEITIGNEHFSTKSNKRQILPIAHVESLKKIVLKRLPLCDKPDHRLFGHSCRRHTNRLFNKYLKAALPNKTYLNIHSLRHTCCINLLRAGVPIYTVQRWLRHADVKTTQCYADLLNVDISEQVGKSIKF